MNEIKYFWLCSRLWENNSQHMSSRHTCWNVSVRFRCSMLSPQTLMPPPLHRAARNQVSLMIPVPGNEGAVTADVPTDPERGRRNYWNKWILKSISQMHKCSHATPSCFRDVAGGIDCNYCRPHTNAHMRNVRANEEYRCYCHTRAKSSSHKAWESIARVSPYNTKKCASGWLTIAIYWVQTLFGFATNQRVILILGSWFQVLKKHVFSKSRVVQAWDKARYLYLALLTSNQVFCFILTNWLIRREI